MSNNKPINDTELDELLRDLYLEENAVQINEAEADFIFEQKYETVIDKKKEKAVLKKLSSGSGKWFFISGLVFLISGLVGLYVYWNIYDNRRADIIEASDTAHERIKQENGIRMKQGETMENTIKIKDTFGRPKAMPLEGYDTIKIKAAEESKVKDVSVERTVPFISTSDIVRYRKIKEQMLSRLINKDKGLYTQIPAAKTKYAGKEIIMDGYILRNVGITNLEYKTFLADLLSQKRNDDYLAAEVRTENWTKQGFPQLGSSYFSNEKYNDFPAVNISYDAAALFCKWLQEETDEYIKRNKIKGKSLTIRMPYDEEWIFAAREGYAKIAFEKGYNTIYDPAEGLVDKNFTKRAELVKKRVMRVDTMYSQFTTNHYGWTEKEILDFFGKGSKYYKGIPFDTIYIDRMKVLGKIGRVSEMTGQRNGSKIWLTGLSWPLKEDYQKLENEFKTNLSSPFVGFRIVVIDPNDPEYKNPFW
jgi:hypothetical protein